MGKFLDGLALAGLNDLTILLLQFGHGHGSCAAGALVAGYMDALDVRELFNGLKHNNHHDGGAVGVGNDAAGTVERVLGIALGHNQGHIGVHAEGRAVVNHHSAILGDGLGKLQTGVASGTGEGNVHILEVVVVLQQLYLNLLSTEIIFGAGTAGRAEQHQFVKGEVSLFQHSQELLSYSSAGTYNSYFHFFLP